MYNAIYWALLNEKLPYTSAPWALLMPSEFEPRILDNTLHTVQQAMIPVTDPWTATYKARLILDVVLADRYKDFNKYPDGRHTPSGNIFDTEFYTRAEALNSAAADVELGFVYPESQLPATRVLREWVIEYMGSDTFSVLENRGAQWYVVYNDGITLAPDIIVKLDMTGLSVGARWQVSAARHLDNYIVDLLKALRGLPGNVTDALFTPSDSSQEQDMTAFRRWYKGVYPDGILAGVVFAYVRKYFAA